MKFQFRFAGSNLAVPILLSIFVGFGSLGEAIAQVPSGTVNFIIKDKVDAKGRTTVTADWTTPLSAVEDGGDDFLANNSPVAIHIGPDANLFSITNLPTGPTGISTGPLLTLAPNSVVDNYGVLESYPQGYPSFDIPNQNNRTASVIQMADNTVVNNYGVMGFMPTQADDNYGGVATTCVLSGQTCNITNAVLNNYGLIVGDTPVTTGSLPGPGMIVNNFAGAKLIAGGGSPILGATSYNFQDAGLIDLKDDGSYCTHTGSYSNAYNWGYCLGIANGYWLDQGRGQSAYDYGGPLVPSSIDMNGNLVFNGTISSTFFEYPGQASSECPTADALQGSIHIVGNVTMNFFNTLYTTGKNDQVVDYLPATFGFPMYSEPWNSSGQHIGPLSSVLNFNFAGLTLAQQQMIQAAVIAGSSDSRGSFTLDGQTYAWCPFMKVNVAFTNTIAGNGTNGFPLPGVFVTDSSGRRGYYTDTAHLSTNPYFLTNAATVRLVGNLALQPGRTVIAPGWTLAIGAQLKSVENNALVTTNYDDSFSTAPANGDSIRFETDTAHTTGNINNVSGQTRTLSAALVIDNPTQPVTLPNLTGEGDLMQEGAATTTLVGTDNTLDGSLYLADGVLKIASGAIFKTPPSLIIGVNDWRQAFPTFDISALIDGSNFTVRALQTAGPQIQTGQVGTILWYPTINLGSSSLTVGNGASASSKFIGGLIGTGKLIVAQGTFLDLGGLSAYDLRYGAPVLISTYSGGTKIENGATLMLENLDAVGTGPVKNAGTLELGNSIQFLPQESDVTPPPATANPLHCINLPSSYTQTPTGSVLLRVDQNDAPGLPGSGAGYSYEVLDATGPVSLSGSLNLKFINGYSPPMGGATFTVVRASKGIDGSFSQINIVGSSKTFKMEQQIVPGAVLVTVVPN